MPLKVVKNYHKSLAIGLYTNSAVRALPLLLVSHGMAVTDCELLIYAFLSPSAKGL
jgi:hypothetical protein